MEETNIINNAETSEQESQVKPTAEEKQGESKHEVRTFTQEEVDAIVNKRLAKERRKQDEALKLSKMNEEERQEYQYKNKLAELQRQEEELNKRESEFNKRAMLTQTQQELINRNLPTEFANLLVTDNAESTKANIDAFNKSWNEALSKAVDARIKVASKEPRANRSSDKSLSQKDVKGLSLSELANLKSANPDAFKNLK